MTEGKLGPESSFRANAMMLDDWIECCRRMAVRAAEWIRAGRPDRLLLTADELAEWDRRRAERPPNAPELEQAVTEYIVRSHERLKAAAPQRGGQERFSATRPPTVEGLTERLDDLRGSVSPARNSVVGRAPSWEPSRSVISREPMSEPSRSVASRATTAPSPPSSSSGTFGSRLAGLFKHDTSSSPQSPPPRATPSPPPPRAAPPPPSVPLRATDMEAARARSIGKVEDVRAQSDLVDVTVFAPPQAKPESSIMVQVMLHMTGDMQDAKERAALADDTTKLRASSTLEIPLPHGAKAVIMLSEPSLEIAQPVQTITWRGRLGAANFVVKLPTGGDMDLFPTVHVSVEGAVVGMLRFKLDVRGGIAANAPYAQQEATARRTKRVFMSYSSQDRPKVLEIAQAYRVLGIDFFQDVLHLDPGTRWENGLYTEIDRCDTFLLFWSKAASGSKWVEKEARRALERQKASADGTPALVPLVLEGPPAPKPPDYLKHLHFNDWMRFAIAAAGTTSA